MIERAVDSVPPDAILYVVNAAYFRGDWHDPFVHEATRDEAFTLADGSKTEVQMMRAEMSGPYTQNDALQMTRLAYEGERTSFYVMLPKPGVGTEAARASLAGGGFSALRAELDSMEATDVVLGLPKLDTESPIDLKQALSDMGMPLAFDALRADFSGIATTTAPVFIRDIAHVAKIKVDEKGTEAAAATVVTPGATASAVDTLPPEMICDRPYLFTIVDEPTGAMLFLGVVNDPNR
jgi:serpin B